MRTAILGFGKEGKSLLKFLKKAVILDQKLDTSYLDRLDQFDLIYRSPGVPYNLPKIQNAIKKGVKFSSATKLFFDLCPGKIIGVTGTKGKGTTSTLIYQILKNSGKKVLLAGNIGKPVLDILPRADKNTFVVFELSSFQLQDLEKSPEIAVIVDIFPDHLDIHKNMKEYLGAKSNAARHQKKSDTIFYFKNNLLSRVIAEKSAGKKVPVIAPNDLSKNKIMAAAVTKHLGCPPSIIEKTIKNFPGMEHRMEFVYSNVLENIRIDFYNDSASTNPQTTAAAILSFGKNQVTNQPSNQSLILIAGGKDKNLDYAPLAKALNKSNSVKQVILIGENKEKIKQALSYAKAPVVSAENLISAVKKAHQKIKQLINLSANQPITVLFSPGAASFDMFKDYKDRGSQFKKIISTKP
ncbi:MAG: UDP-N-acetylmuramoyl-L-alanine--D-glutamate ligase [Patescibacteria group bacterium]